MLADVVILLKKEGGVRSSTWCSKNIAHDQELVVAAYNSSIFGDIKGKDFGSFDWRGNIYQFSKIKMGEETLLLLRGKDDTEDRFRAALDHLEDGFQIYDENANLVYINTASRKLSGFEGVHGDVEGSNLMDLYQVTDINSTVLTAMRTRQAVLNRVASFLTTSGKTILTINNGYPLFSKEGRFLGVLAFEQDVRQLNQKRERLERISKSMDFKTYSDIFTVQETREYTLDDYIGKSRRVREALTLARSAARKECSILLLGETGTGKEIFAQGIHRASERCHKKFVALNCAAVPEQLVESILFGTEKGAFTGSIHKRGLFEEADGGTVYLDELNSMSLAMQAKILRVLQERTFLRVGGNQEIRVDVRVIASCNEDAFQLIQENKLRRDLFYRIATVIIELPPLREHLEDLETLIWHRHSITSLKFALPFTKIDPEVLWVLQQYDWPGNVRELNHVVDHTLTVSEEDTLLVSHLPAYLLDAVHYPRQIEERNVLTGPETGEALDMGHETLQTLMDAYENQIILQVLRQVEGNVSKAAGLLGLKRQSLQYRMRKYKIRSAKLN